MCYCVDTTNTRSFNSVGPRIDQTTRRATTPPTPTPSTCVGVSPPPPILPTQREQDSSTWVQGNPLIPFNLMPAFFGHYMYKHCNCTSLYNFIKLYILCLVIGLEHMLWLIPLQRHFFPWCVCSCTCTWFSSKLEWPIVLEEWYLMFFSTFEGVGGRTLCSCILDDLSKATQRVDGFQPNRSYDKQHIQCYARHCVYYCKLGFRVVRDNNVLTPYTL